MATAVFIQHFTMMMSSVAGDEHQSVYTEWYIQWKHVQGLRDLAVRVQPFSGAQKPGQMAAEGWKECSQWCSQSSTAVFLARAALTFIPRNSVGTEVGFTSCWTFTEQLSNIRLFYSDVWFSKWWWLPNMPFCLISHYLFIFACDVQLKYQCPHLEQACS